MFLLETAIADASNGFIYPQVEHMGPDYPWEAPDSVTQWAGVPAGAKGAPNLRTFHLDPATHFTDIVSQGYLRTPGLLLSARLALLLARCELPAHQSWPATLMKEAERRDYRWLEFSMPAEDAIDWQRSEFVIQRSNTVQELVRFDSEAQLARRAIDLVDALSGSLWPKQIVLKAGTPSWDLFMLKLGGWTALVSDGLAQTLHKEGMSGFQLRPL